MLQQGVAKARTMVFYRESNGLPLNLDGSVHLQFLRLPVLDIRFFGIQLSIAFYYYFSIGLHRIP